MAVLEVKSISVFENGRSVISNLDFTIQNGEHWAVVGPSGSGKTTLLHVLCGTHSFTGDVLIHGRQNDGRTGRQLVLVEQQHRFRNLSNTNTFYYQQRFNSSDSEDAVTVEEDLKRYVPRDENGHVNFSGEALEIMDLFRLRSLLQVKLIQLSNGENKRLQIAKALLLRPSILLLDYPFTGLDVEARKTLTALLEHITSEGIHIILVTAPHHIPSFVTHVLSLEKDGCYQVETAGVFRDNNPPVAPVVFQPDQHLFSELAMPASDNAFEVVVEMKHVNVQYNHRVILDDISWTVRKGERWSLSGPNGSGKSTLLSLINADNPQAYANEIYLFDRRRGSGETIWEIKKRIGFVSPELHLYFDTGMSCFDVVASGLFDTIGLFRMLNDLQESLVHKWMELLQIPHLKRKLLFQLSNSEQRLVLLARALVKNPPMLILDEPCQGLDEAQVSLFKSMVNEICIRSEKTLIYVSHYPGEIPECVDKYIRLVDGRTV
jgi:molybdate transport system ATP-binding protein